MYSVQLPPITMTADKPVRSGNQYLFTGTLWVGGVRMTIATTVPAASLEKAMLKARGALARVPNPVPMHLKVRGFDDNDVGAFDLSSMMDTASKVMKSPLGQVARGVLGVVPGVNMIASPTLAAFDAVQAMRKGNTRKADRVIKKANVQPADIKRAKKAMAVMSAAQRGSSDAQRLIGAIRSGVNAPGSNEYLDSLALDAANALRTGYELPDYDGSGEEENEEDDAAGWPDTGCACQGQ